MRPPPEIVNSVFNTVCDYRCRFCSHSIPGAKTSCWSYEDVISGLGTLWDGAKLINISGCGEVTVVPYFEKLMDYLSAKPGRVCFSTNGYNIDPERLRARRLDHVVFSVHSLTPAIYDYLTGTEGRLPRVLENVRAMALLPRDYRVVITSVVTAMNVGESAALAEFASSIGADEMRFLPLADPVQVGLGSYGPGIALPETTENLDAVRDAGLAMTDDGKVARQLLSREGRREKVTAEMHDCQSPAGQIVINMDGEVQPCCFIPPIYGFGNVLKTPWQEIWDGLRYEEFRGQVASGKCGLCLQHCMNWG